uniref:Uncharacterized protein n=1 Tax=Panagrolaimus sp. PS1159 TaxID=55785 RepID=A0AC35EYH5_9BILA
MHSYFLFSILLIATIAFIFIPVIEAQCNTNAPNGGCWLDYNDRDGRCGYLIGSNRDTRFSFDGPRGKCYCCPA